MGAARGHVKGGSFVSRSGAEEFYRVQLAVDDATHESISFEKTPGQRVTLTMSDLETVIADQPGRPLAVFRRTITSRTSSGS